MSDLMTCTEELIESANAVVDRKGVNDFGIGELVREMRLRGTGYAESTIRTHIVSRCCSNAPKNHGTKYDHFERIGRGRYRLRKRR